MISRQIHFGIVVNFPCHGVHLHVFGNVDQNRSRATGPGDVKRFFDNPRNVFCLRHQIVMFGDGSTDFDHRRFLKGIAADQMRRHLSRNRDHRNTVHFRISNCRYEIRGTWAAGSHTNADAISGSGNALSGEGTALFVSRQNRPNIGTAMGQRLMQRHAATAGIGENDIGSVSDKAFNKDIGTGQRSRRTGNGRAGGNGRHDQNSSKQHAISTNGTGI